MIISTPFPTLVGGRVGGFTMQKTCRKCGAEFDLKPGKPGFVDECPTCSDPPDEHKRRQDLERLKEAAARSNRKAVERNAKSNRILKSLNMRRVGERTTIPEK
jgi:hypothetical protein